MKNDLFMDVSLCKENGCSLSTTGFMSGLSGKETSID
jgi:hypothetical protein